MYGSDSEASYGSGQEEESGGAAAASASSASAAPAPAMSAPRMYPPPFADAAAAMAGTGYTVLGRQVRLAGCRRAAQSLRKRQQECAREA